jgi:hypothetical protein
MTPAARKAASTTSSAPATAPVGQHGLAAPPERPVLMTMIFAARLAGGLTKRPGSRSCSRNAMTRPWGRPPYVDVVGRVSPPRCRRYEIRETARAPRWRRAMPTEPL